MDRNKAISIPIKLSNGEEIYLQVERSKSISQDDRIQISSKIDKIFSFREMGEQINSLSEDIYNSIKSISPDSFSIEFSIAFEINNKGTLTALLVNSATKGSIKVILNWERKSDKVESE